MCTVLAVVAVNTKRSIFWLEPVITMFAIGDRENILLEVKNPLPLPKLITSQPLTGTKTK